MGNIEVGSTAKDMLGVITNSKDFCKGQNKYKIKGYYRDSVEDAYIVFDNTNFLCKVSEFKTLDEALAEFNKVKE